MRCIRADGSAASDEEDGKRQEVPPAYDASSINGGEVICPPHTTERKITTKIDMHLIPFVIVLYILAFLDRVNIANARAFGLEDELGMSGVQYNTALTIFFVPYVLFEIPSNILLKYFSPRIWLSICCLGFGAVTVFQGLVQNYGGLLTTRFFLGLFECGMWLRGGEKIDQHTCVVAELTPSNQACSPAASISSAPGIGVTRRRSASRSSSRLRRWPVRLAVSWPRPSGGWIT